MLERELAAVPASEAAFPKAASRCAPAAVVGLLTILGAALRLYRLGAKALWFDEAVEFGITQNSLLASLEENARVNSAPPLYPLLLRIVATFGDSEAALRGLACVGGIVAVPAMYLLARRFLERPGAYLVALLTAVSPMQIRYSQQVREYSITFVLAALLVAAAHAFAERPDRRRAALFAATLATGAFLQYGLIVFGGALLALLALWASPTRARRERLYPLLAAVAAVWAVALAAVYEVSLRSHAAAAREGSGLAASYLAESVWSGSLPELPRFALASSFSLLTATYPGDLFLLLVGVGFVQAWRRRARFPLAALVAPTAAIFVLACLALYPFSGGRQNIFLMPMILVFGGLGAASLLASGVRRPWIAALLAAVLALSGMREARRYLRDPGVEDVRPLLQTFRERRAPADRLYVHHEAIPAFEYYFPDSQDPAVVIGKGAESAEELLRDVDAVAGRPGRLWILFAHCARSCELVADRIARRRPLEKVGGDETAWLALAP